jgi:hypothetical protein
MFGLSDGPAVRLMARGWSAMVEEAVLAWLQHPQPHNSQPPDPQPQDPQPSKAELLRMLTAALPAVLLTTN